MAAKPVLALVPRAMNEEPPTQYSTLWTEPVALTAMVTGFDTSVAPGLTKAIDGATGRIKLDVQATDQRGQVTALGWAKVRLPRR